LPSPVSNRSARHQLWLGISLSSIDALRVPPVREHSKPLTAVPPLIQVHTQSAATHLRYDLPVAADEPLHDALAAVGGCQQRKGDLFFCCSSMHTAVGCVCGDRPLQAAQTGPVDVGTLDTGQPAAAAAGAFRAVRVCYAVRGGDGVCAQPRRRQHCWSAVTRPRHTTHTHDTRNHAPGWRRCPPTPGAPPAWPESRSLFL
jgi:hypothetical protein